MKKKYTVIVLILILVGFITSCQKYEIDKLPPIDKEAELAAAKQWYGSRFGELSLKSAVEDSGSRHRVVLKPGWETAKVHHNRRLKSVEAVLIPQDTAFFFVNTENIQKFEETRDARYLMSLTRLVLQTHRRTGRQTGFMMTISPSVKYLEQTNFTPFKKMSYIGRDKKFDGRILFHHTDGTFANGWVYCNGKITHSIKSFGREEEPVISLKSTGQWECNTFDIYALVTWCTEWFNEYYDYAR